MRTKNKTTNEQSDDDENDDDEDDEKKEKERVDRRAREAWRNTRTKQKEKNDPQFRPLPERRLWPHRPVFIRSSAREPSQRCINNSWSKLKKDVREDDEANESGEGENNKKEEEKDAEWNELTDTCPVNTESALEFETDIFKGKVVCRFLGLSLIHI